MSANVTIDGVVTEDVAPAVAPHRVSLDAAHATAHVTFHAAPDPVPLVPDTTLAPDAPTLTPDPTLDPDTTLDFADGPTPGDSPPALIGYGLKLGGTSIGTGTDLGSKGACGALPCSPRRVCGTLTVSTGQQIVKDLIASELAGADGAYAVNVYMQVQQVGWS